MADAEKKQYIMTKKRKDITAAERLSVMRPLGFAGLPFPTVELVENASGEWVWDVQIAQDMRDAPKVFSDRTQEQVTGTMYREMPAPLMMAVEQKILEHTDPLRGDRVIFVMGDSGWGKTHAARKIGNLLHPEGAIIVDMGGMNAQELVWKTVIDYGKGTQELLDKRLAEGQVSMESLNLLEEEFPNSVIRNKDKPDSIKDMRINWPVIGTYRRQEWNEAEGKMKTVEDRGEAVRRANSVLEHIYKVEKIQVQENAFGIKMVKGELIIADETGRPLFTDEINKAQPGTINSLQSILDVHNGNSQSYRAQNPTPESGERGDNDSPAYYEFNRDNIRGSFLWMLAGNERSDGATTFDLSKSTAARAVQLNVGDPQAIDWAHKASQNWTGMPLTTYATIFGPAIAADPEGYPGFLMEMRKLGLEAEEILAIPPHQLEAVKSYANTVQAANNVGEFMHTMNLMSREDSNLLKKPEFANLTEELSERAQRLNITPRKLIEITNSSLHRTTKARPAAEAKVSFNLKATLTNIDISVVEDQEPAWRSFGANMIDRIRKELANMTVAMPRVRAAAMKLAANSGIVPLSPQETDPAVTGNNLAALLRYDQKVQDVSITPEVLELRSVLLTAIRGQFRNLRGSDETVLPIESVARSLSEIKSQKGASEYAFVVPNSDLNMMQQQPLTVAKAVPVYDLDDVKAAGAYDLVPFQDVLAAIALPQFAEENRKHMWPQGFVDGLTPQPPAELDENGQPKKDADGNTIYESAVIEPYRVAEGKGFWGFNLSILQGADKDGEPAYIWVLEDKTRLNKQTDPAKQEWHRYMVVGPEPITPELEVALQEKGMRYVVKGDPATQELINDFLIEGADKRADDDQIEPGQAKAATAAIIRSFAVMHTLPRIKEGSEAAPIIPGNMTLGEMITLVDAKEEPAVYTALLKPKKNATPGLN